MNKGRIKRDQREKKGGKAGSEKPIVDAQHSSPIRNGL